MSESAVRIDPAKIPDYAYEQACRVLYSSISRALADPKLSREYEEWKQKQDATKSAAQEEVTT